MKEIFHLLDQLLEFSMPHLVAVPILVPMLTAALMLLLGENRRRTKSFLSVVSGLVDVKIKELNDRYMAGGQGLVERLLQSEGTVSKLVVFLRPDRTTGCWCRGTAASSRAARRASRRSGPSRSRATSRR